MKVLWRESVKFVLIAWGRLTHVSNLWDEWVVRVGIGKERGDGEEDL